MTGTFVIPFKGRNKSLADRQNLLWCSGNIYVMDNHRAALWCWLQHMNSVDRYNVYHVDAHYDCRSVQEAGWLSTLPNLGDMTIDQYLTFTASDEFGQSFPAITWDNYLSLFLHRYANQVGELFTSTHLIGDEPDHQFEEVRPDKLPSFFHDYVVDGDVQRKWIVNIDLDYFFARQPTQFKRLFSLQYERSIFDSLRSVLDAQRVAALTVCLSPECTPGWRDSERLCQQLCGRLGLLFDLP